MRVKVLIFGDVVGVFFRRFVNHNAIRLGLKGYVKNAGDKVEAVFVGLDEKVDEMISLCKQGPAGSKVEDVKVINYKSKEEFNKFEVR